MDITSTGFCLLPDTYSWSCSARYSSIVSGGRLYFGACCSTKSSSAHAAGCRILDREVGPGAYVYVPAGCEHAVSVGPWGCTFFFVYAHEPAAE